MAESTQPAVTQLEGRTKIDATMSFGPERLSYASAVAVAERVAREIEESVQGRIVVIAGTALLADLANLEATRVSLQGLVSSYDALASHAEALEGRRIAGPHAQSKTSAESAVAALALPGVTAAATSVLGLVSLFRQDVEYVGAKTVVNPLAFELALAAKLKAGGAGQVFVPDLMAIPRASDDRESLRALVRSVEDAKGRGWGALGPLVTTLVRLEAALDKAAQAKDQKEVDRLSSEVSSLRRDMDPVLTPLGRADRQLADLQSQWSKPQGGEATGVVLLGRLLRAEAIAALQPLYVHAAVVSSGGHHRTIRNLFRMMFLGDGLTFAGGAIVRWALLEANGAVSAHGGISTEMRSTGLVDSIAHADDGR